jgi:predicted  nucleic acid-binding Zn ribbon protein
VGTWAANALLKWIHEMNCGINTVNNHSARVSENIVSESDSKNNIVSYEEFKQVALQVYEQLNSDYNLDNLVPIYRIRRKIGDRLSRKQFSEWLLEMQADDIFQLEGGSVEDSAPDKIEDSITTELDGLRCYASKLQS